MTFRPPDGATPGAPSPFDTIDARLDDLEAQAGGIVSVTDPSYGAAGDNSADDTAEIQAAIDAVEDAGGGDVWFPEGIYRVSSALSVPNFVNLRGQGQNSVIRCTGDHYAINFNPGNRVSVSGLQIDAVSSQASGGGFDFTNAAFNIRIDDIYIANNLHTAFNIKPAISSGHFQISRVKFNGTSGSTNGFLVGDGTNLVADVSFSEILGVAATTGGMTTWMTVKNFVDTLHFNDVLFYRGGTGILLGENASGACTNLKASQLVVDTMTGKGINCNKVLDGEFSNCAVQTCGDGSNAGFTIGANCTALRVRGGVVQACGGNGIEVVAGSVYTELDGVSVHDNNTTDTASRNGISVAANTNQFQIRSCRVGNNVRSGSAGHQKLGIQVATGTSTNYQLIGNYLFANETSNSLSDNGTGMAKVVYGNLPVQQATVASAAAITLPTTSDVFTISGTADITSIVASMAGRRVTLVFSGTAATNGLVDGSNLKLASTLAYTPDDSITLTCNGTNWYEAARSVN